MHIWMGHQKGGGCDCPACSFVRDEIVTPLGQELDPAFIPFLARELLQDVPDLAALIARKIAEKN